MGGESKFLTIGNLYERNFEIFKNNVFLYLYILSFGGIWVVGGSF